MPGIWTVFPTHVGVDRRMRRLAKRLGQFSPRTWGWTGAGVWLLARRFGFPHARGGGLPWGRGPRMGKWTMDRVEVWDDEGNCSDCDEGGD
jgi:hypothetical protein